MAFPAMFDVVFSVTKKEFQFKFWKSQQVDLGLRRLVRVFRTCSQIWSVTCSPYYLWRIEVFSTQVEDHIIFCVFSGEKIKRSRKINSSYIPAPIDNTTLWIIIFVFGFIKNNRCPNFIIQNNPPAQITLSTNMKNKYERLTWISFHLLRWMK